MKRAHSGARCRLPKVSGALIRSAPAASPLLERGLGLEFARGRQQLRGAGVEALAIVGQRQAPGGAMEQPHAQLRFEVGDMARHGGLRQPEASAAPTKLPAFTTATKLVSCWQVEHRLIVPDISNNQSSRSLFIASDANQ